MQQLSHKYWIISYSGLSINFTCEEEAALEIEKELSPFYVLKPASSLNEKAFCKVEFNRASVPQGIIINLTKENGTEIKVDTSLYSHLRSNGKRWEGVDDYIIEIELTNSFFIFSKNDTFIKVFQPDVDLLIVDAVRLIKNLFTPALENAGNIQIHSSGIVTDDKAILLMGDMWQGKTTLLLDILQHFKAAQLSCDTVVISPEGHVSGWPSPFSVSHGTLSDHPKLYKFFPEERRFLSYEKLWKEGKKAILTSQQVVESFQTEIKPCAKEISLCLFVRFKPEEATGIIEIKSKEEIIDRLQIVYLGSRDPIYHN
jgi:hypothetical protein